MTKRNSRLRAIVGEIARGSNRSPLFWWLVEHHDEVVRAADGRRFRWEALCAKFAAEGLTDVTGKPPAPETARRTWLRARKMVAALREREAAKAETQKRVGATPPSRLPKDWRPSGFTAPPPPAAQLPAPTNQPPSPSPAPEPNFSLRSNDGRPPELPRMTLEEEMEFLKGRGPYAQQPHRRLAPEEQIARIRGQMNLRSGRPWNDPGDRGGKS